MYRIFGCKFLFLFLRHAFKATLCRRSSKNGRIFQHSRSYTWRSSITRTTVSSSGGEGRPGGGGRGQSASKTAGNDCVKGREREKPSTVCWDIQEESEHSSGSDLNIEQTVQCDFIIKYNKTSKLVKKTKKEEVINEDDIIKNREDVDPEISEKNEDGDSGTESVSESKESLMLNRKVILNDHQ